MVRKSGMAVRATVLGCGEAFDESVVNTSLLVEAGGGTILMDCGYSVPPQLWKTVTDPAAIDLIYISHLHADHYFGLPAVLGRMWEDGRTSPLTILSQAPAINQIRQALEFGYAGLAARFQYPIEYVPASPGKTWEWRGITFDFAPTRHSVTNLAVRLGLADRSFAYSGDGMFTDESRALFSGVDLVVHEAYLFEPKPIHADIPALIRMAEQHEIKHLALIHVQRDLRARPEPIHEAILNSKAVRISLPGPMDVLEV